ncbi:MAG TPA: hypothetical protein VI685_03255 [Candidatus Angelobacter sp.]
MENYFNYFTEIEQQFQRRRGTGLILSTLDWALIETWKDAGIPLEAVLRGIDTTFDRWEQRPSKTKKINGLAFCAQEVLAAAEDMKEAAVGAGGEKASSGPGLNPVEIKKYFLENVEKLRLVSGPAQLETVVNECVATLTMLAEGCHDHALPLTLEDLERYLTVLEEKLLAALTMTAHDADLLAIRTEADREIAPYRSKMPAAQVEQLRKQFVHKRLLEHAKIPRLSLFYM